MADDRRMLRPAIGIDLGTTYPCVAVWQRDRVEIIVNDQGNRTTPSCVAFTDMQRFINDASNPTNSVFESQKITITNDKARLPKEEINRMIKDAQNFEVDDDKYKEKAKAKGVLEGYAYAMKNALEDEKIRSKLEPAFKKKIEDAILRHLTPWLDYVQLAEADENLIKKNLKEIEQYYDPFIAKIKQHKQSSSST